ncbi:MAG: prolyl oligopeptidase family serine peptidase [Bacteroidia bacterium]|nr:prolyl oligopeptidase family serine peptidase [Bacteroidia bacterium]MDW8345481.1 prolyl oligopeptidase family serine peptidase [Bacteroidia bacterium]
MKTPFALMVCTLLFFNYCFFKSKIHQDNKDKYSSISTKPEKKIMYDTLKPFQTLFVQGHAVDIALPLKKIIQGNILVLPGFGFPKDDWCKKTSLCKKALEKGYILIMPEMGKSNYVSKFYPQTRKEWQTAPQKVWLVDTLFTYLQKRYGLLLPEQNNFVVGLSTGGRGAAVCALAKPELFSAVATLSGDFDQSKIPNDKVMIGYYGEYSAFKERWQKEDNIIFQIREWKVPVYIGHGKLDPLVPYQQSELLYHALQKECPQVKIRYHLSDTHGHNYAYWESEVDAVLAFFEENKRKKF